MPPKNSPTSLMEGEVYEDFINPHNPLHNILRNTFPTVYNRGDEESGGLEFSQNMGHINLIDALGIEWNYLTGQSEHTGGPEALMDLEGAGHFTTPTETNPGGKLISGRDDREFVEWFNPKTQKFEERKNPYWGFKRYDKGPDVDYAASQDEHNEEQWMVSEGKKDREFQRQMEDYKDRRDSLRSMAESLGGMFAGQGFQYDKLG
jgi:hypothetical protein